MASQQQELTPIQQEAFDKIARHVLVGCYARISTVDRQQAVFSTLNRRDALVVSSAIIARYGGALGVLSGYNVALFDEGGR
jgi:hypothetical protein